MLQLLDLLAGEVSLGWWGVPLEGVGSVLGTAGFGLPAGASSSALAFRQDERVGALAVLDLVKASVAVIIAPTSSSAAAAAAAATTCTAALRPSPLVPSSAARNHQKRRQREPGVAKVVPQHHIS